MPTFVKGVMLAERFYHEAVRPLLDANFPSLPHSAGLIGTGSEVLGFDTSVSSDHHWGPRAQLFLGDDTYEAYAGPIREMLRRSLPHTFRGWPTNYTEPNPEDHGAQMLRATAVGPVNHRVHVGTLRDFFLAYLGCDLREPLHPIDWLTFPSQKLRSIVAGAVFHDGVGLQDVRTRFAWYPHDVWLYMMAAGWQRIGQEEHLMGRAGEVGDEIGSSLIAGRLVRDLMRLCFLMEQEYAPYAKWYGTAFSRLRAAHSLSPLLWQALRAEVWPERDRVLGEAYSAVARLHNALGVTDPQPATIERFFGRPFSVIFAERLAKAIAERIEDPRVRQIPLLIGGVDQWSDSTDVLEAVSLRPRLTELYRSFDR